MFCIAQYPNKVIVLYGQLVNSHEINTGEPSQKQKKLCAEA